jgi:hypothetical protein
VLLGITGNIAHFRQLRGQQSAVHQAFLGWGQGQSYGSPFKDLLTMFGPVPMFHLGTAAGPSRKEAITPAAIAAGRGDSYIVRPERRDRRLRQARLRPSDGRDEQPDQPLLVRAQARRRALAAAYQSAFCRIFILLPRRPEGAGQRPAAARRASARRPDLASTRIRAGCG